MKTIEKMFEGVKAAFKSAKTLTLYDPAKLDASTKVLGACLTKGVG